MTPDCDEKVENVIRYGAKGWILQNSERLMKKTGIIRIYLRKGIKWYMYKIHQSKCVFRKGK